MGRSGRPTCPQRWLARPLSIDFDDRLPLLAGWETNANNSANQGAFWWVNDESESPQPADVGVTRLYVLKKRDDRAG